MKSFTTKEYHMSQVYHSNSKPSRDTFTIQRSKPKGANRTNQQLPPSKLLHIKRLINLLQTPHTGVS